MNRNEIYLSKNVLGKDWGINTNVEVITIKRVFKFKVFSCHAPTIAISHTGILFTLVASRSNLCRRKESIIFF